MLQMPTSASCSHVRGLRTGSEGITAFLVDTDTPGFEVSRIVHTLRSGHPTTEVVLEDVRVPDANVFGGVGNGFKLANARLAKNRIPYSAACIGVAVRAQHLAVEYTEIQGGIWEALDRSSGHQLDARG